MMYTKASNKNKTTHESATNTDAGLTTITKGSRKMATSDSTTRTCTKCNQTYPATSEFFSPRKSGKNGLHSQCRSCVNKYLLEWQKAHPDKVRESNRKRMAKINHGLRSWEVFFEDGRPEHIAGLPDEGE